MSECLAAYTKPGDIYPGYVNFTRESDGSVTVHLRGDSSIRSGKYVCGGAADKGQPGRCTPGDVRCNNYCNMAPQKGPMQSAPAECLHVTCGGEARLHLAADQFEAFMADYTKRKAGA